MVDGGGDGASMDFPSDLVRAKIAGVPDYAYQAGCVVVALLAADDKGDMGSQHAFGAA
jgi:hypothetical protein